MKWTFTWRRDCFWRVDDSVGVLYFSNMSSSDSWAPNRRLLFPWNQLRNTTSVIDSTLYSLEHVFSNCVNVEMQIIANCWNWEWRLKDFMRKSSLDLLYFSGFHQIMQHVSIENPWWWNDVIYDGVGHLLSVGAPIRASTILRHHTHWFQSRSTFELLNALIDDHWLNSFHYMWHALFYTSFL